MSDNLIRVQTYGDVAVVGVPLTGEPGDRWSSLRTTPARELGHDCPAAGRCRSAAPETRAAEIQDALAQSEQAAPGSGKTGRALQGRVVLDEHGHCPAVGLAADQHPDLRSGSMTQRVGQALLDDSEWRRAPPLRRSPSREPSSRQVTRSPLRAACSTTSSMSDRSGLDDVGPGEQVDQALQVGASLPGRLSDDRERFRRCLGRLRDQPLTRPPPAPP